MKLASCLRREMEKMEEKKNKHGPLAAFLDRFFIGLHLAPAMPLARLVPANIDVDTGLKRSPV